MKVLIVGSGGREHALAWKLKQSPLVREVFVAPGNGGTALEGRNVAIKDNDLDGLCAFARDTAIDLVVAGPELPPVLGLRDKLDAVGVPCFGPNAFAAQMEGSKAFAKRVMREAGVPTADFAVFDGVDGPVAAKDYIRAKGAPIVLKADGLAAGKGVIVAQSLDEALAAVDQIMVQKAFGAAGERLVVEEALVGEEASFIAFCDGEHVAWLPSSQDHKRVGDGDTGPNTGGMGAYSPAPIVPDAMCGEVADLVIRPITRRLAEMGAPFRGILYAGLMLDHANPGRMSVLEYNVRFGDPECQPLLMRLETDLAEIMLACVQGRLDKVAVRSRPETSVCVVMAAAGYPGSYPKGMVIEGLEAAEALEGVKVFQAGTALKDGKIVTSGGRVLGVTALGADLGAAQTLAYQAVERVRFEKSQYRRDIGAKGLRR